MSRKPEKRFQLVLLAVMLLSTTPLFAKEYWAGIYAGKNSGISYKHWKNRFNAYDYGVGWSFKDSATIHAKADYLTHHYGVVDLPEGILPLYYGVGVGLELGSDVVSGVRIPVGANYLFAKIPFDAFVEIAPVLHIYPETIISFTGAIAIRYHFEL